jgi:hypothetical protein
VKGTTKQFSAPGQNRRRREVNLRRLVGLRSGISPFSAKSGEDIPSGIVGSRLRLVANDRSGKDGRTRGTPTNCPSDRANPRQFRDRRLTFVDRIKIALGLPPHRHIPRIRAPTSMRTFIVASCSVVTLDRIGHVTLSNSGSRPAGMKRVRDA